MGRVAGLEVPGVQLWHVEVQGGLNHPLWGRGQETEQIPDSWKCLLFSAGAHSFSDPVLEVVPEALPLLCPHLCFHGSVALPGQGSLCGLDGWLVSPSCLPVSLRRLGSCPL